ncbi:rho guanine nucleotide exchange factor 5 isoform X2 [Hippoglossus hippoglossus]|uniref:rho guanine nucleotide exchange factor 5 isoform X2 n=1 Tax=Hippoglossus hippoglossus TaxID=8267 RepID=UPI00148D099F|nr:rho guanine nucleotide exchange factor 5 isoform X2 [Hippoglossus hippoglossus]
MAQSDYREENLSSSSSSIIANLHSYFGNIHVPTTHTREQLSAEFPTLETDGAQDSGALDESDDSLQQHEDNSSAIDISSAMRSVALKGTWNLAKMLSVPKLLSVLIVDDEDQDTNAAGEGEPVEEEEWSVSFQSKYIQFFPLYQDYCLQAVKNDLHSLDRSFLSELITPLYLQGLQFRLGPSSHSETTSPQSHPAEATPSSPSAHPIRVTPCTLWQDLDEVKESGLLCSLTAREIRLQESMFELIGSEASYLRSLGVVVNHFQASKALKQTLSPMEHHFLFSNIRRVMAASEKFLMDLETRLGESVFVSQVGDIVLQHSSEFHKLYVPYVTNIMYQKDLVNKLLQQNRDFVISLKKLESDPVCQRQDLKSFLVLPFQRITRFKLLLESILKLTEPDSESISNLEKAIEVIHEIVTDCNKGVQKMKQIEELVCLETLLDFDKVKAVPLVVSGRFLVHQGPMRQLTVEGTYNSRTSFISVYFHLFNDLLIISSKKDQRFIVLDHTEFPAHVRVEHLKTQVLNLPSDSILLHLSQSQVGHPTAMIFVTYTRSDKEAWMKLLSRERCMTI